MLWRHEDWHLSTKKAGPREQPRLGSLLEKSERDIVFLLKFAGRSGGCALWRSRALLLGRAGLLAAAALRGTATATGTAPAIGKELEAFSDDFEFAAFLAGFLVVPSVHLEAAFDVCAAALGEVLLGEFRLAAPEGDIDEDRLFLLLVLLVVPNAVDRKGDIRHGGAFGSVSQFGIPGEVPDEHDFVQIGHNDG